MYSCRTCQLRKAYNGFLHLAVGHHHQVCQLVYDNNDLGKEAEVCVLQILRTCFSLIPDLLVEALQITDIVFREELVPALHFLDCPVQCACRLLCVRHYRDQHVGKAVVCSKLHLLRVDHDHPYLFRLCLIEDAHDDGVDADGLTGTGSTCDQHMGHLCDIPDDGLSADILTDGKGYFGLRILKCIVVDQFSEGNHLGFPVGNLDTDGCLARDRGLDTDVGRSKIQLDIIL